MSQYKDKMKAATDYLQQTTMSKSYTNAFPHPVLGVDAAWNRRRLTLGAVSARAGKAIARERILLNTGACERQEDLDRRNDRETVASSYLYGDDVMRQQERRICIEDFDVTTDSYPGLLEDADQDSVTTTASSESTESNDVTAKSCEGGKRRGMAMRRPSPPLCDASLSSLTLSCTTSRESTDVDSFADDAPSSRFCNDRFRSPGTILFGHSSYRGGGEKRQWQQSFWVRTGPSRLEFFRPRHDFDDWSPDIFASLAKGDFSPSVLIDFDGDAMANASKEGTGSYEISNTISLKYIGRLLMYEFSLERRAGCAVRVVAEFASSSIEEVLFLRSAISGCLGKGHNEAEI